MAGGDRGFAAADFAIALEGVERDAGERATHLEAGEPGGDGGIFCRSEEQAAEALAREVGVDEDGADFGGVVERVEAREFFGSCVGAGEVVVAP